MVPMNDPEMVDSPTDEANGRKTYEVGFLIVPSVAEESLGAEVGRIRDAVERFGGAIVGEGYPSLRALHYEIAHRRQGSKQMHNQAYFGYVKFTLEPEQALAVKTDIEKIETVLRFLFIIAGKENPIMAKRPPRSVHVATPVDTASKRSLTAEDEAEISKGIEELLTEEVPS